MIHELRTYTTQPGRAGEYVELSGSVGRPIRGDRFGRLIGYFASELGSLNQVLHLWEYADLAARATARAGLAQDERWRTEYLPRSTPLLQAQENMILSPADWYPLRPPAGDGNIYELRVYRLHPGKVAQWMGLFRAGLPAREKHSAPVGVWSTEVGPLNTVAHLWAYRDPGHRAECRRAALADPAWKGTVAQLGPLMQAMTATLLAPAPFSPLR
jgi:hypothetical protein